MQVDWELSRQFVSDSQGVRAACVLPPASSADGPDSYRIVTGNQGGGLCEFGVPSGSLTPIEYQHNHGVTALLSDGGAENAGDGGIYVTGCKDALVRVFDSQTHQLRATLKGHEKPVTSLAFAQTPDGRRLLVTGSWDMTAKVWDLQRNAVLATLPDHENSVCVTGLVPTKDLSPDQVLIATGSAGIAQGNQVKGHTVRIWRVDVRTGQVDRLSSVADDHGGPIRDIATLTSPEGRIATCSNDGTVRLRSCDGGDSVSVLTFAHGPSPHPPMLLSVRPLMGEGGGAAASVAASAEDGHVVVWSPDAGDEPQILPHPSCVWNVVGLPGGDLATCCQDGTLRIFTRASSRMAPAAEREAFAQAVQEASKKQQTGPSAEEVAKLPPWEHSLQKQGTSEGQVQIFNKTGVAIAAQWSMASRTWIEVGQVMGSADGGMIDGVQYDHVLPIEVDQTGGGVAKLQIGYNNGENPFVAAQRFIDSYMLPQYHLNDIADYIQQRVGSATPTLGGGARGGNNAVGGPTPGGPVATTGIPMVSYQHLPAPAYKFFELPSKTGVPTLDKMKKKIADYGRLTESQLLSVSNLMDTLAATNRYHSSSIQEDELKVIADMLDSFPPSEAFPALDLARLTVLHPDAAALRNTGFWNQVLGKALSMCPEGSMNGVEGPAAVAIPMLTLRLCVNAFRGGPGSLEAIVSHLDEAMACNEKFIDSTNKNIRLSVATFLYNASYYLKSAAAAPASPVIASQVVVQVDTILKSHRTYETEALTRALVCLGTTAMSSPDAKETAKSLFVVSRVEMAASPHGDLAKAIAKEVYNALS